jgi:hypothetical protein
MSDEMRGMNDGQIERVFGALSRIETKVDNFGSALITAQEDVLRLKISQARQRGFITALGAVGTAIGAGIGYVIDVLIRGGHH